MKRSGTFARCWVVLLALSSAFTPVFAQLQFYSCVGGFGPVPAVVPPAALMAPLSAVPNPVIPANPLTGAPTIRPDLAEYIKDLPAAIRLGKALFWDMQAGSDGKTACGSCHFHAGADSRSRYQLNGGRDRTITANQELTAQDFPFVTAHDDITGSQGIRTSSFGGIGAGGTETTTPIGAQLRQVTNRNSPSVVNAVFNHRQFWDGRAQPEFNGVNPFGSRDANARLWVLDAKGNAVQRVVNILNASLASQAVGPALSTTEMSAAGRTFPELGKKMLLVKPLGRQDVNLGDSVLGSLAEVKPAKGLKTTYSAMIEQAFQPAWWNGRKNVTVNGQSYTMKQANFSLYWGLSIMLYQATLVADRSPMDQYLATRVFDAATGQLLSHNPSVLNATAGRLGTTVDRLLNGLALFELPVAPPPSFPVPAGFGAGCIGCHLSAETTSASVRNLAGPGVEAEHVALKGAGFDGRMERMFSRLDWNPPGAISPTPAGADRISLDPSTYAVNVVSVNNTAVPPILLPVTTYDVGWYNLGVRPTIDDDGLGGEDAFKKPLSWTASFQTLNDPSFIKVPGGTLECATAGNTTFPNQLVNLSGQPLLSGPLKKTEPTGVAGAFKTPSLRNLELTGPYFHNGSKSTLRQVIEFYNRGGDFSGNPTRHPLIVPLALTETQKADLVSFLLALGDERVTWQRAPFDRPSIVVPHGPGAGGDTTDRDLMLEAIGAGGSNLPLSSFLGLNPFSF